MEFVLNEYHRNTPNEKLLEDVRRVATSLSRDTLSMKEYIQYGQYAYNTVKNRFGSWDNVLREAGLSVKEGRHKVHCYCESEEEFFNDVRRVAKLLDKRYITCNDYEKYGEYAYHQRTKKYGDWNAILEKAQLEHSPFRNRGYTQQELFDELERVWIKLGRQPAISDMKSKNISQISPKPFMTHFGSWRNALVAFVNYINDDAVDSTDTAKEQSFEVPNNVCPNVYVSHKTKREIGLRLRFRVMARDNFKCCLCGKSPALDPTVVLHIDHIHPYSKGGETVMENLQTLCSECNLGKSDLIL